MNNFLLVPDNGPSWEGFMLTTSTSLEDVKKLISEFKKYCKDTDTSYGSEDFLTFLSNKGIDASIAYIDKMINF
jgi:Ca2+-binding EF-hand superfamily protein